MRFLILSCVLAGVGGLSGCSNALEKAKAAEKAGNHAAAFRYYRVAAASGNLDAQVRIGELYEQGVGTPKSWDKAIESYEKAAKKGHRRAQANLGAMYVSGQGPGAGQHMAEAYKWLKEPAEAGDARAQGALGYLYKIGFSGVPQNFAEAVKWLMRGAAQGDAFSQLHLAFMYQQGEGVAKDPELAAQYLEKAAAAGHPEGMRSYGMVLQLGRGVEENKVQALRWYLLAVARGNDMARANANVLQGSMTAEQIDEAQRLAAAAAVSPEAPASALGEPVRAAGVFKSPLFENKNVGDSGRGAIAAIAPAGDGLLVGGDFDQVDGKKTSGLVRLHADGSLDWRFGQRLPPYIQQVRGITVQRDGRILVVNALSSLIRLNPDGSQDTGFFPFRNSSNIWNVRLQPSGKILYLHSTTSETYIGRLNPDATPDAGFKKIRRLTGSFAGSESGGIIHGFEVFPDGRVIAVGQFDQVDGTPFPSVVRFQEKGEIDPSFKPVDVRTLAGVSLQAGYPASVSGVAVQSTGNVLLRLGLGFKTERGFRHVIRLRPDGALDERFQPVDVADAHGASDRPGSVNALFVDDADRIYIAGFFGRVNDIDVPMGLARLDADGRLDPTFRTAELDFNDEVGQFAADTERRLYLVSTRRDSGHQVRWKITRL